jgi:predicted nucleotidyltransferase component of viral defense system
VNKHKTKEILSPLQEKVLQKLFAGDWFKRNFYLTGGTALSAFYLYHRFSDDLDFFTHVEGLTGISQIMEDLKNTGHSVEQVQKSPGFLRYLVDKELKLDFVKDVPLRFGTPELMDGCMIDCLENIAVNKVCSILGRTDPKDYVDLYFIMNFSKYDILDLLDKARKKDAGLELFIWASLIDYADGINLLPRMIKELELTELKKFYLDLKNSILDSIKPL